MKTAIVLCAALSATVAHADQVNRSGTYKVGDTVEVWLNVNGPLQWVPCTILEINGADYKVHYGGGRYNVTVVTIDKIRNEAREKADAAVADLQRAFWDEHKTKHERWVGAFAHVMDPSLTGPGNTIPGMPTTPETLVEAMADLAALDASCTSKYKGLRDTETVWKTDYTKLPGTWCKVAAMRTELAAKTATERANEAIAGYRAALAKDRKSIEARDVHIIAGDWYAKLYPPGQDQVKGVAKTSHTEDLLDNHGAGAVASAKAAIGAWYAAIGVAPPPAVGAFLEEYGKELAALEAQLLANIPPPVFLAKGHDAAMEAGGKAGITGKVLKSAVLSPDWVVTVNRVTGKPIDRVKIGTIFYQAGSRCVYRSYAWKQDFTGGRWSAGRSQEPDEFYQRCK